MSTSQYEARYGFTNFAERLNGRLAMLGIIAAIGSYVTTGQLVPGLW